MFSWKNKKKCQYFLVEHLIWSYATANDAHVGARSAETVYPSMFVQILTLVLLNLDTLCFANSVDPDQLVSEEAN